LLIEFCRTINCCMIFNYFPVVNFYIIFLYYSLSQLTQLEELNIGYNTLNTLPDVVSSLTSLKQLNMNRCGISSLPERFVCHMFIATTQHPAVTRAPSLHHHHTGLLIITYRTTIHYSICSIYTTHIDNMITHVNLFYSIDS